MSDLRRHTATTSLLALLGLFACDADFDPDLDAGFDPGLADPGDADELDELSELEAPAPDEHTVSCDLGLDPYVIGGPDNAGTVSGVITGISTGYYTFEVMDNINPHLQWWEILINGVYVDAYGSAWAPAAIDPGDTIGFGMQAPWGAPAGWTYDLEVQLYSYPGNQLICTDQATLELGCADVAWWATSPWPSPTFDGANCYVTALPVGAQAFIWDNNWYVEATNGNQCSIGVWDNANCYIGSAPYGHDAFIWDQKLYFTP